MPSGAPFTSSRLPSPFFARVTRPAGPAARTSTLMLFRSRLNSRVATLVNPFSHSSHTASAWSSGLAALSAAIRAWAAAVGAPSFSTSTRRAASVGDPRALKTPSSPLYSMPASLHMAITFTNISRFGSNPSRPSTSPSAGS